MAIMTKIDVYKYVQNYISTLGDSDGYIYPLESPIGGDIGFTIELIRYIENKINRVKKEYFWSSLFSLPFTKTNVTKDVKKFINSELQLLYNKLRK